MVGVTDEQRRLPPHGSSVGEARRHVREVLDAAGLDEWLQAAQLAVSEVITNALVHAGTAMDLRVIVNERGLRVEVTDGNAHLPSPRDYVTTAATGRGLKLVGEVVDDWGAHPLGAGKVVWFEIWHPDVAGSLRGPTAPATDRTVGRSRSADALALELLNVPLLTHAAWQQHAASALRELLLVHLDDDVAAFETHAAASDALNVFFEQIPAPELRDEPGALMASATEPGVTEERLVLEVQQQSVPHFDALDQMLDEATVLADAGRLLTAPTQPEIRELRRWLCGQVRTQHRDLPPEPWAVPADPLPPSHPADFEWDSTAVSASSRTLLAADDTNRIAAVSRPALELLGYDDPADLVGHRLLRIIPWRYRQAHLAGFTLHLTNGRRPLLDQRVSVPVLRRDGSETQADMLVVSHSLPHGRRLFVAEFFPASPEA